jgi:hypothetical protein
MHKEFEAVPRRIKTVHTLCSRSTKAIRLVQGSGACNQSYLNENYLQRPTIIGVYPLRSLNCIALVALELFSFVRLVCCHY